MKISVEWLREWVDLDAPAQQLAEELTVAGLEVDEVAAIAPDLPGVVVAHVRDVRPHPGADRLTVCTVFDGTGDIEIVCGAPNVRADIKVPLAPVGAVLPGGLRIKAAKIRGQQSNGMLCSARELGLSDDAAGLLILDGSAAAGTPLEAHLRLPDAVIDVDLTPNRGDCFSVIGIARELAARRTGRLRGPEIEPVAPMTTEVHAAQLEAPVDCPRFVTRIVTGIKVDARTPDWMQERLRRVGLRPISPVVDVTNYVMWELGQPLHAYSAAKLTGHLRARRARADESLELLDGTEIGLGSDVLVIADDTGAVGLAGVMGGASTAIDSQTTAIVLESAFFSQAAIQGRARRYGLHTDASVRFERGVDPTGQVRAIERATALLIGIAGGRPGPVSVTEAVEHLPARRPVALRLQRAEAVLGVALEASSVETWLTRLGMRVEPAAGGFEVTPPPHRFDIAIEEDLIEEIGRMMGYDSVVAIPGIASVHLGFASEKSIGVDEIADLLVARGYVEVINYSFIDPSAQNAVAAVGRTDETILANPLSMDMSVMRSSLWPGLLRSAQLNLSHQRGRCRLFETGTVFAAAGDSAESTVVGGLVIGTLEPEGWESITRDADYFDVKADVAALLEATGRTADVHWQACEHPALSPVSATRIMVGDHCAGYLGGLHPTLERTFDLRKGAILFELDLAIAFAAALPAYRPYSRFPHVRRDLAVVVDERIDAGDLTKLVTRELGANLYRAIVFDEYRGKALESGRKSIGLGLILQDASRTLTDADADRMLAAAMQRLVHELGATIRT